VKWTLVDRDRAPRPTRPGTTRKARSYDRVIADLRIGKVARIEPEDGGSLRGLRASVTRAAGRAGQKVRVWDHDGTLYVELA